MEHSYKQERYEYLASRWKEETISPLEETEFLNWLNTYEERPFHIPPGFSRSEGQLKEEIYLQVLKSINTGKSSFRRIWIAAASIFLVLGLGLYSYRTLNRQSADVPPGKAGATLTLANGKKIKLSEAVNGELAKETGIVISKAKDGQLIYSIQPSQREATKELSIVPEYNVLSTARGQTYHVILPDGTHIWLNAASSIKYASNVTLGDSRKISLNGEAYFEVAKDKNHPFIVESKGQEVSVLGTHFNISSYVEESETKTTLLEGSVHVALLADKGGAMILKPGEQSVLGAGRLQLAPVDIEEAISWKNGEFIFKEERLESVLRKVSRWYNVDVVYDVNAPKNIVLGGYVSRSLNLSSVLEVMERVGVHFKVEGNKITVLSSNN